VRALVSCVQSAGEEGVRDGRLTRDWLAADRTSPTGLIQIPRAGLAPLVGADLVLAG
jgi:hypothetical protein